jgi:hypothetical protein
MGASCSVLADPDVEVCSMNPCFDGRLRAPSFSLLVGMCLPVSSQAAATPAPLTPIQSYSSLQSLPEFGGSWTLDMTPVGRLPAAGRAPAAAPGAAAPPPGIPPALGPLVMQARPEVLARLREALGTAPDKAPPRQYCRQPDFTGIHGFGAGSGLEILLTPGRVTIATQSGLLRRIYMRSDPPPDALEISGSGTSIGQWEGSTLLVQTSGLNPKAQFLPGSMLGNNAHVTERFTLRDAETLEIASTLTAPDVLLGPRPIVLRYLRNRDPYFTEFVICDATDRSVDPATGQERFDTTPPPDLPPPPTQ